MLAQRAEPILTAAEELFAERGYAGVELVHVAEHVGLQEQYVYNYVGSKQTLMLEVLRRGRVRLLTMLDSRAEELEDPRALLESGLGALLAYSQRHFEAWEILQRYAQEQGGPVAVELERSRRELVRLLSQLITEVREAAGFDPGGVNTETTAAAILGAVHSVSAGYLNAQSEPDTAAAAAQMARTLWGGLIADFR